MTDNYSHLDDKLIYVGENIPGPYVEGQEYEDVCDNFSSQLTNHCQCKKSCQPPSCSCLGFGQNYIKCFPNGEKYILNINNKDLRYPIMECNSLCECDYHCGNKYVQHGPMESLVVKTCEEENKGLGLFTEESIPSGTFICEYAGEILTKSQALLRHQLNLERNRMNYIFCLNEHTSGGVIQTFIDPSLIGNIGRYVNHSCDPNCQVIPVRIDAVTPKLAIFSCQTIGAGAELTFSYGLQMLGTENAVSNNKSIKKPCLCGSTKCTGFMPYEIC